MQLRQQELNCHLCCVGENEPPPSLCLRTPSNYQDSSKCIWLQNVAQQMHVANLSCCSSSFALPTISRRERTGACRIRTLGGNRCACKRSQISCNTCQTLMPVVKENDVLLQMAAASFLLLGSRLVWCHVAQIFWMWKECLGSHKMHSSHSRLARAYLFVSAL